MTKKRSGWLYVLIAAFLLGSFVLAYFAWPSGTNLVPPQSQSNERSVAEKPPEVPEVQPWHGAEHSTLNIILTLALSISAMASALALAFLLHKRSVLIESTGALVPEKWGEVVQGLTQHTVANLKSLRTDARASRETLNSVVETVASFANALDAKDEELKRLKSGYDVHLLRNFMRRFVKVYIAALEFQKDDESHSDSLQKTIRLLNDALEECGIEIVYPEVGTDYRDQGDLVADTVRKIDSDVSEKQFTIAEVIQPAFCLSQASSQRTLVPAIVAIYQRPAGVA